MLEDKPVINEMWGLYLRNCSCQIASTDLRSYAPKVCNQTVALSLYVLVFLIIEKIFFYVAGP